LVSFHPKVSFIAAMARSGVRIRSISGLVPYIIVTLLVDPIGAEQTNCVNKDAASGETKASSLLQQQSTLSKPGSLVESSSAKFATGQNGDEDLGEDIDMKGVPFHFLLLDQGASDAATAKAPTEPILFQDRSALVDEAVGKALKQIAKAHGMAKKMYQVRDAAGKAAEPGHEAEAQHAAALAFAKAKGVSLLDDQTAKFATGLNGDEDLGEDIIWQYDKVHFLLNQEANELAKAKDPLEPMLFQHRSGIVAEAVREILEKDSKAHAAAREMYRARDAAAKTAQPGHEAEAQDAAAKAFAKSVSFLDSYAAKLATNLKGDAAKHAFNMNGDEDLAQDLVLKGEKFHFLLDQESSAAAAKRSPIDPVLFQEKRTIIDEAVHKAMLRLSENTAKVREMYRLRNEAQRAAPPGDAGRAGHAAAQAYHDKVIASLGMMQRPPRHR